MGTSSYALYNNSVVFVRQLSDFPAAVLVTCSFSASTGNNNQTLGARIAKNGSTIAGSESEVRQNTASQAAGGVAKSIVSFATNDYIELFVTNKTATNAVTVEYMNLTAR